MKITDSWKTRETPTLSFELFPARSEKATQNLEKAIDKLASLEPDFVSVTFGAGGSTREGSRQLLEKLKLDKGLQVIAYFACFGIDFAFEQCAGLLQAGAVGLHIYTMDRSKSAVGIISKLRDEGLL